jgi:type 1 glutamine amidotransferase
MRTTKIYLSSAAIAFWAAGCGEPQLAAELNEQLAQQRLNGSAPVTPEQATPGQPPAAGDQPGVDEPAAPGGQPSAAENPSNPEAPPGAVFVPPAPGTDEPGGSGAPPEGGGEGMGMGMEGTPDVAPAGPFTPRTGSFRMLVYSRTTAFRHDSIAQGKLMLQEIASEQGFEITETEVNDLITPEGLAQFEIVFFMNSTGDIFNQTEEAAFQQWMETRNGAYAGVHSATDTEQGWAFYKELTGQYYDGHVNANTPGAIQFEADVAQFPAVAGLPNPWQRNEEWYRFNSFQEWSIKPGFRVLGRKAADNQPITWVREFGNWRSFYTGLGHDSAAFRDPAVKQHVTGGIMWAVRREQLMR